MKKNGAMVFSLATVLFFMCVAFLPAQEDSKGTDAALNALVDKGDQAFEDGKFEAAVNYYGKALELDPQNLVIREKYNDAKLKLQESKKTVKYRECLNKSDLSLQKGNIKYAVLYLVEALRSYPDGKDDVRSRLLRIQEKNPEALAEVMMEKREEMGSYGAELEAMLQPGAAVKKEASEEGFPAEPQAGDGQKEVSSDVFLGKVKAKANDVHRNEGGYWEAVFPGDIVMIQVPEGDFTLGSGEDEGDADELPAHKVFLSGYWLAMCETTFEQYDAFCQDTGREKPDDSGWGRGDMPVINVSWVDAQNYCTWLSNKTGLTFRLPSEAEWEKAAHGYFPWGDRSPGKSLANYRNRHKATTPVGSFPDGASVYGMLDMAGNVWEWVGDWYDADFYGKSPRDNPRGPENGTEKSVRGGSWRDGEEMIRSANRDKENPASKLNLIGFRILLESR